jgi:hypothetical protein
MEPQPPMYATIVTYTCGCVSTPPRHVIPPPIGEDAYCMYHERVVMVAVHAAEWVTRCRRCNRNRYHYYGAAKLTALTKATAHAGRTRHSVEIWHGGELVEMTGPDVPGQIPLTLF